MAESNWYFFHKGLRALLEGSYNFSATNKWLLVLQNNGDGPPDCDTSTTASLSFTAAKAAGQGGSATRTLQNVHITASASNQFWIDHDALVFTATTGSNFSAKHAVLFYSGAAAPVGFFRLSTTAVVASQITVNQPTGGMFSFSASYTLAAV